MDVSETFVRGKDFVISSESIRRISNFMSLQVVEGRLDLNATKNLRSLDGLQNLRRVGSGDIALGSSAVKNGEQFGKCGFIMLDEDKFESNKLHTSFNTLAFTMPINGVNLCYFPTRTDA